MLKIDELREIIKMVDQSSLQRFELEQESAKLVMVKNESALSKREPVLIESCITADNKKPVMPEGKEEVS